MNKPRFLLALGLHFALAARAEWAQTSVPAVEATTTPDNTRYADPLIQPKLQACEDRVAAFKDKPCDLIFIGDSITQFWLSKGRAVWEKMYAPRHALDFGVGGDKTQNVLWRLDNIDLKNLKPKVAVILIGTNNRADTPQGIADGVKAVITRTQNLFPGVKIILVSVMPCRRYEQITAVDAIIKNFTDNKSIYYLDLIPLMTPIVTTSPDGKPDTTYKGLGPDYLHPDAEGYQLWADAMEPLLRTFLPLPEAKPVAPPPTPAENVTAQPAVPLVPPAPISTPTPPSEKPAPNIIFILADDLGYGDLSISGNPYIKTPNLDALARHSIICTKGYAAYPICLPSRVSILSGKYSDRTGARMCIVPSPAKLDQPWLPMRLKAAGYTTCAIGKWGLGDRFPTTLRPMGFDTWAITHPGGGEDRYNYLIRRPGAVREPSANRYVTDVVTDEAIKFIDQNSTRPFFIYLAEPAPHWPLQAPEEEVAPFRDKPGINPGAAVVYAMVQHLDKKVGDLIAHLKEKKLFDNTIIVFTSDNGPDFGTWMGLNETRWNDSLAGHKGYVWEGGIKVPTFISWPAAFGEQPKPFDGVVDGIDWQPTLCAAAGVTAPEPPIDGVNLLPRFLGQSADPIPTRFWNFNIVRPVVFSNGAMRDGDWKLMRPPIPEFNVWAKPPLRPGEKPVPTQLPERIHPGKNPYVMQSADLPPPAQLPEYELFNLATDPGEKHDLAAQDPERLSRMRDAYEEWFKEVTSGPDNVDPNAAQHSFSGETVIPQ